MNKSKIRHSKIRVGDVFAVTVDGGFGLFLYSHQINMFGSLIRVLRGIHPSAESLDLAQLVDQEEQFNAFYLVELAFKKQLISWVNNVCVPENKMAFPLFRDSGKDFSTGKPIWWVWDGVQRWPVENDDPKLPYLSDVGTINHAGLVQRIETKWTPLVSFKYLNSNAEPKRGH